MKSFYDSKVKKIYKKRDNQKIEHQVTKNKINKLTYKPPEKKIKIVIRFLITVYQNIQVERKIKFKWSNNCEGQFYHVDVLYIQK